MIITSNLSANIHIKENEINVISFQDTRQSNEFVRNFMNYLSSKEDGDDLFTEFIDDNVEVINAKKINSIIINCGNLDIVNDKQLKEAVLRHFENQLFKEEEMQEAYTQIEISMNRLLSSLKIEQPLYQVELDEHSFKIKQFLKLFSIDIHANNENMTAVESRCAYIDLLKDDKKENILILLYPEANLGLDDFRKFNKIINEYDFTTIMVTNHPIFIKINDNINLMKSNKTKFDLDVFVEEFKLFMKDTYSEELIRELAFMEFTSEKALANESLQNFLNN